MYGNKVAIIAVIAALSASSVGATGFGSKTYNHGGAGGQGGAGGNANAASSANANAGAFAVGKGGNARAIANGGTAYAKQGQNQGQLQGQAQGQKQGQSQSSSASNMGNAQNLNISSDYDAAAYAPDVNVGECQWGLSAGIPGAVAGLGIPGRHCRVLTEAELIEYYWGREAAAQHLYDNNRRIRATVSSRTATQTVTPTELSTRSRTTTARVTAPAGESR